MAFRGFGAGGHHPPPPPGWRGPPPPRGGHYPPPRHGYGMHPPYGAPPHPNGMPPQHMGPSIAAAPVRYAPQPHMPHPRGPPMLHPRGPPMMQHQHQQPGGAPPGGAFQGPPPPRSTVLYAGKLPPTVEDELLQQVFEACGEVERWRRQRDPSTNEPQRFGLCTFKEPQGVLMAHLVLKELHVDDAKLMLKMDKKTQAYVRYWTHQRQEKELLEAHRAKMARQRAKVAPVQASETTSDATNEASGANATAPTTSTTATTAASDSSTPEKATSSVPNEGTGDVLGDTDAGNEEAEDACARHVNAAMVSLDQIALSVLSEANVVATRATVTSLLRGRGSVSDVPVTSETIAASEEGEPQPPRATLEPMSVVPGRGSHTAPAAAASAGAGSSSPVSMKVHQDVIAHHLNRLAGERREHERRKRDRREREGRRRREARSLQDELERRQHGVDRAKTRRRREDRRREAELARALDDYKNAEHRLTLQREAMKRLERERVDDEADVELETAGDPDRSSGESDRRLPRALALRLISPAEAVDHEHVLDVVRRFRLGEIDAEAEARASEAKKARLSPPTDPATLFAHEVAWEALERDNVLGSEVRPWLAERITQLMGAPEPDVVDWIAQALQEHQPASNIVEEMQMFLEDEAEAFVVQLWTMLVGHSLKQ